MKKKVLDITRFDCPMTFIKAKGLNTTSDFDANAWELVCKVTTFCSISRANCVFQFHFRFLSCLVFQLIQLGFQLTCKCRHYQELLTWVKPPALIPVKWVLMQLWPRTN